TPLMHAASNNKHSEIIKMLLDAGADLNARDKNGNPPLMYSDGPETFRLLVNDGAKVNMTYADGETLLMRAGANGAKLLVDAGANVNITDNDGETPLISAVRHGDVEKVKVLLAAGADVKAKDKKGVTPLIAINRLVNLYLPGCCAEITKVLLAAGADAKAIDNDGSTALMGQYQKDGWTMIVPAGYYQFEEIVSSDCAEVARLLIEAGVDVNAKNKYGCTALMLASNPGAVKVLIDKGADVNAKDNDGRTALMHVFKKYTSSEEENERDFIPTSERALVSAGKIVATLLEHGANVKERDKDGRTALMLAYDADIAKMLIEKGAGINVADNNGNTPLMYAVRNKIITGNTYWNPTACSEMIAKVLVVEGADVNAVNKDGQTALMLSSSAWCNVGGEGSIDAPETIANFLLHTGATTTLNAADKNGLTALMYAARDCDVESGMVKVLLDAGADLSVKTKSGVTALDLALANSDAKYFDKNILRRLGATEEQIRDADEVTNAAYVAGYRL
nr:ankyrin repeat domain-containing protein [Schwartzia sp. (in: firmicutes)]